MRDGSCAALRTGGLTSMSSDSNKLMRAVRDLEISWVKTRAVSRVVTMQEVAGCARLRCLDDGGFRRREITLGLVILRCN